MTSTIESPAVVALLQRLFAEADASNAKVRELFGHFTPEERARRMSDPMGVARRACAEPGLLVPMEPTVDPRYLPDSESLALEAQSLFEQHFIAEACLKLDESQARAPRIGTLLNLAACHQAEGKLALSLSEFTKALALAQAEQRPDFVKLAQLRVAKLEPQISTLTVVVPQEVALLDPEVRLDGKPLPAWGVALPVDPGAHLLEARADGCAWWSAQLTSNAREQHTETVPALSCGYPPLPRAPTATAGSHREKEGWKKRRELAAGLALVGAFPTVIALGLELGNDPVHDANPQCGVIAHSGRPHCIGVANRHEKAAVTFGIGMASLAASFVLWLTATPPSQNVALGVGVAPTGLHARVTW